MKKWPVQDAKNKFSQVAEEAVAYGPQVVTRHGRETVVVVSIDEYRRLTKRSGTLSDFLLKSPLAGSEIDCVRESGDGREVDL